MAVFPPADAVSELITNFRISDPRPERVLLQGTFTVPGLLPLRPVIEVSSCWAASGIASFGMFLLVGPGETFPLDSGTVNLPKNANVQMYVVGKFLGGGVFCGGQISRRFQLPPVAGGTVVNWALYPAIVGASIPVPTDVVHTSVVVLPDDSKVYATSSAGVLPVLAARTLENWIDLDLPNIDTTTAVGINGPTDLAVAPPTLLLPSGVLVPGDSSRVYVANFTGRRLQVIDTKFDDIVLSVNPITSPEDPDIFAPYSVTISLDGTKAYVTDVENKGIVKVNLPAGTLDTFYPAPTNLVPVLCRMSPDGTRLAVSCSSTVGGNFQLVVYNTATMAVIGAPLDLGYSSGSLLPVSWELPVRGANNLYSAATGNLWIGRHGPNDIKRVLVTATTVAFDTTPSKTFPMPKVEWTAISPDSGKTLFAVGSSTTAADNVFAYFDMTASGAGPTPAFDSLTNQMGPGLRYRSVALSSDVFIYLAQSAPGTGMIQAVPGGRMYCSADPTGVKPEAIRTMEYCRVSVWNGSVL